MDKDGYHGYDMNKLASTNTAFTFQKPQDNNIIFFNSMGGTQTEVLRISKDGVTANPDVPTDEAADAVIRALDGYIKNLIPEEQDPDELTMSYLRGVHDGKNQRTWNALTELEMAEFVKTMERGNFLVAIYDIEKKLKEKNA